MIRKIPTRALLIFAFLLYGPISNTTYAYQYDPEGYEAVDEAGVENEPPVPLLPGSMT